MPGTKVPESAATTTSIKNPRILGARIRLDAALHTRFDCLCGLHRSTAGRHNYRSYTNNHLFADSD